MSQIKHFEIKLNNEKPYYAPGDELAGSVIVKLSKPLKVKSVRLTIKGKAKVKWYKLNSSVTRIELKLI